MNKTWLLIAMESTFDNLKYKAHTFSATNEMNAKKCWFSYAAWHATLTLDVQSKIKEIK